MPLTQDIVTQVWISQQLTLLAVSPQICRPQEDWPASVGVCGFLDMPNIGLEGTLPDALATFLEAGDAPVYMTLGSWMPRDIPGQANTLRLLTQAARLAGCRAIIQSPAPQECGFQSCDQFLYLASAPHHAIFPHCRAVLHHGGAGTTQSATLAGKPSIVVSHISEQEHWGRELRRIGIGAKPVRRSGVTAASLARRIREVLASAPMAAKARAVATAMKREDGVAEAVKLVMERFGPGNAAAAGPHAEPASAACGPGPLQVV
jgi:UDP:flavonoid glycosyltransferase YjiC (YdhE family)